MIQSGKKSRIIKVMVVALAFCLTMGIAQKNVMAASTGYTSFPYVFTYVSGMPTASQHLTQTVEVNGNNNRYAYAECGSYSGSGATLVVVSITSEFPTESASFTYASSMGMRYLTNTPSADDWVTFQGQITKYSSAFTISASVKG